MEKISFDAHRLSSEEVIRNKVDKGFRSAMTNKEYYRKIKEFQVLSKQRSEKGLDETAQAEYNKIARQLHDCLITVSSIMEYKRLLELIPLSAEKIIEIISHENAHANVAEQLASKKLFGYTIRFCKDDKDGTVSIFPSVQVHDNPSFPERQILEEGIRVSEAPLHYGNSLSAGDIDNIKKLKQNLDKMDRRE